MHHVLMTRQQSRGLSDIRYDIIWQYFYLADISNFRDVKPTFTLCLRFYFTLGSSLFSGCSNPSKRYYYDFRNQSQLEKEVLSEIDDLSKEIENDLENAEAYINRADLKLRMRDFTGAIADYTKALKIKPQNVDAYSGRSRAKDELGDSKGAIADLDQAIENDPHNEFHYSLRGQYKKLLGNQEGACADWTMAAGNMAVIMVPKWLVINADICHYLISNACSRLARQQ